MVNGVMRIVNLHPSSFEVWISAELGNGGGILFAPQVGPEPIVRYGVIPGPLPSQVVQKNGEMAWLHPFYMVKWPRNYTGM